MTVYLVGAGPGDPGLLTVRAAEVLAAAEVVVHDRLAEATLLDLAPAAARRIDVGKAPGGPIRQDRINDLLVSLAAEHATVVRLKGGDPFVFGRGGEEALALTGAGVDFEVVPGITSAVAVAAYAGVPVTHRGLSTSFTVVTGHRRDALDSETDWTALAAVGGTVVVLMGVAHRAEIARRLMAGGMGPGTPVTAVQWGTRPEQRTTRTTLAALGDEVVEPPATMIIGAVAGLDLAWYERRPLLGRRVVVTRAREQASGLATRLAGAGARVVEVPTIAVTDPADGGAALARAGADLAAGRYDWVAFTSANAVARLAPVLRDTRDFAGCGIAVVRPRYRGGRDRPPPCPPTWFRIGPSPRGSWPSGRPDPGPGAGCSSPELRRGAPCWRTGWSPPAGRSTWWTPTARCARRRHPTSWPRSPAPTPSASRPRPP